MVPALFSQTYLKEFHISLKWKDIVYRQEIQDLQIVKSLLQLNRYKYLLIFQAVLLERITTVTCMVTLSAPHVPGALFRSVVPAFALHVPVATQLLDLGPLLRMIAINMNIEVR